MHFEQTNPFDDGVRRRMMQIVEQSNHNGVFIRTGNDDFLAPSVVLQGAIEHVLAAQKTLQTVSHILGAIHLPTPATPLCPPIDGTRVQDLMASTIRHDRDKLTAVAERAVSIRKMLSENGTVIYAIYPQGGLEKRSGEPQKVFLTEVSNSRGRLKIAQLSTGHMDPARVGALYLFSDGQGNDYAFAIKAQQANSPQDSSARGIWIGPLAKPSVRQRIDEMTTYLSSQGAPDLAVEFTRLSSAQA